MKIANHYYVAALFVQTVFCKLSLRPREEAENAFDIHKCPSYYLRELTKLNYEEEIAYRLYATCFDGKQYRTSVLDLNLCLSNLAGVLVPADEPHKEKPGYKTGGFTGSCNNCGLTLYGPQSGDGLFSMRCHCRTMDGRTYLTVPYTLTDVLTVENGTLGCLGHTGNEVPYGDDSPRMVPAPTETPAESLSATLSEVAHNYTTTITSTVTANATITATNNITVTSIASGTCATTPLTTKTKKKTKKVTKTVQVTPTPQTSQVPVTHSVFITVTASPPGHVSADLKTSVHADLTTIYDH
ncbi:hypothetical protein F4677DRAFT_446954 [Hypoxylon crocopeplum]|nr:hypothetical protein F4677DRAFT_446954 [Hypoxylon crocopeplum]